MRKRERSKPWLCRCSESNEAERMVCGNGDCRISKRFGNVTDIVIRGLIRDLTAMTRIPPSQLRLSM